MMKQYADLRPPPTEMEVRLGDINGTITQRGIGRQMSLTFRMGFPVSVP